MQNSNSSHWNAKYVTYTGNPTTYIIVNSQIVQPGISWTPCKYWIILAESMRIPTEQQTQTKTKSWLEQKYVLKILKDIAIYN